MRQIFSHFVDIIDADTHPVVMEIGACDGFHTQIMASLLRNNGKPFTFHSFEPVASLHPSWENWNRLHGEHVKLFPSAVGVTDGTVPFYFSSGKDYYGSSSLRKPTSTLLDTFDGMTFHQGTVPSTRLDTHVQTHGIDHITFIWMDVQGAERDVFDGARDILNSTHYVYTEYVDADHYEGEYGLAKLHAMLGSNWEIVENYGGDVLFRNNTYSASHS